MSKINPIRIMQVATGAWASNVLGAAVAHSVFSHLERGVKTAASLASEAKISERGARTLLDGLLGLGLVSLDSDGYRNAPDASAFLVDGRESYLGSWVAVHHRMFPDWAALTDAVKTGNSPRREPPPEEFWVQLNQGLGGMSVPPARYAAELLKIAAAGPISILDLGGGHGTFSAVWLGINPQARATQVDFPAVNRLARENTTRLGVANRFTTVDGDYKQSPLGSDHHFVICSHIAHGESPKQNQDLFRRVRAALREGGTLVICDFVLNDDRSGHPMALLFGANMLLETEAGGCWCRDEYRRWLEEARFRELTFHPLPEAPISLIFATAR